MNVISLQLSATAARGGIGYHPKCKDLHLNHLCFADDMMIFMDGAGASIRKTIEVLNDFGSLSGLSINASKSAIYASESTPLNFWAAARELSIPIGQLPIKYLGLPLTTRSMKRQDYAPLIEKVRNKLLAWTSKVLSYAGRLQLIKAVINSITNFWCSVFKLPTRCFREIDRMCAAFLWSGSPLITTKSKIAWEEICKAKVEGGLGLRRMVDSARIFSLSIIWKIISNSSSLWVDWTLRYILRRGSFWDAKPSPRGSWIWNKLLKLKDVAAKFVKHQIKSGTTTKFWLDDWSGEGRLIHTIGETGTRVLGVPRNATVAEVTSNNGWHFRRCRDPRINEILSRITRLPPPTCLAGKDVIVWCQGNQRFHPSFSAKNTWRQIRDKAPHVPWFRGIWFPQALPRQAFISWLAVKDRLSTGDKTSNWGTNQLAKECVLCSEKDETRDHLFFACSYSFTIWHAVCKLIPLRANPSWHSTLQSTHCNSLTARNRTMLKIFFQACIYHIWRERNQRHHKNISRPAAHLIHNITKEVEDRTSTLNMEEARNPN